MNGEINLTSEKILAGIKDSSLVDIANHLKQSDIENAGAFLKSSEVFKPEQSNNLVTPVFEDSRGKIMRLGEAGKERNFLLTYAGFMRSGDLHPVKQYDAIISGKVKIWYRIGLQDVKIEYAAPSLITLPSNIPHLFEFLEDCEMLEWWDGQFEARYYQPYRDVINGKIK